MGERAYSALAPIEQSLVDALTAGAVWSPEYFESWRIKNHPDLRAGEVDAEGYLNFPAASLRAILDEEIYAPDGEHIRIDARGAFFRRVHFTGAALDLTALDFRRPLRFEHCRFECGKVILADAKLDHVRFNDCLLAVLDASRIATTSEFLMQRTMCKAVMLHSARIGGLLSFRDSRLQGGADYTKDGIVLECADIEVGGYVSLKGMTATGEVRFVGARIRSSLLCTGTHLDSGTVKRSLYCGKATIGGGVYLRRSASPDGEFRSNGNIVFSGANIAAGLHAQEARIDGVLDLRTAVIGGSLHLDQAKINGGEIPIYSASSRESETTGIADGQQLYVDTKIAIYCWNTEIRANVFMRSMEALGEVSFNMATIGASVRCERAKFNNPLCRPALNFNNAYIGVSVFLINTAVYGVVDFALATVEGRFICTGARILRIEDPSYYVGAQDESGQEQEKHLLDAKQRHRVFNCDSIIVGGSVLLNTEPKKGATEGDYYAGHQHFTAHGVVYFHNARIGGDFDCRGGRFFNPNGASLVGSTAEISGSLYLEREFLSIGEVFLRNIDVGDSIHVRGASFHDGVSKPLSARDDEARDAIDLYGARIGKALNLTGIERFKGSLDLQDARAENFAEDSSVWNKNWSKKRNGKAICGPTEWLPDDAEIRSRVDENSLHIQRDQKKSARSILRDAKVREEFTYLLLDRFTFSSFVNDTRVSDHDGWPLEQLGIDTSLTWFARYAFLERQKPSWLSTEFRPQPFTQCARAIAKSGRTEDSRKLLHIRERLWLKAETISFTGRIARRITLGWMAGYGYRKRFALIWVAIFWLTGTLIFDGAQRSGMIEAASDQVITSEYYQHTHQAPKGIEPFKAVPYALDVLLPIVDFGLKHEWIPRDGASIWVSLHNVIVRPTWDSWLGLAGVFSSWVPKVWYWIDILTGWFLTTIIAAALAGFIGHQREE